MCFLMPGRGGLPEDGAVEILLGRSLAAVVDGAVITGEVVQGQAEGALEVGGHADELTYGGLVLAEGDIGDGVELLLGLDELHRNGILRGTHVKHEPVAERFPFFL